MTNSDGIKPRTPRFLFAHLAAAPVNQVAYNAGICGNAVGTT